MPTEAPWFNKPPEAVIAREGFEEGDVIYGFLHFIDPQDQKAAIPVTLGDHGELTSDSGPSSPIWHIDLPTEGTDIATVSPSVHFIGHWHSPNPVQFKIIDKEDADHILARG